MEGQFSQDALMVARNILSGNNACGALQKAVTNGDAGYFAAAAEAALKVRREEIEQVRSQRGQALREVEKYRFALELLAQNAVKPFGESGELLVPLDKNLAALLEKTLGRRIFADSG